MRKLFHLLTALFLVGCGALKNSVVMSEASEDLAAYVVDNTKPDDYPSELTGEGNIYSCRYGIHHQSAAEFSPPKAAIFGSILRQEIPGIEARAVVLERFDVYHNKRLRMLAIAGEGLGGGIGNGIARVGRVNEDVFTFDKLQVDINPGAFTIPEENMVGCDKAREGEYYASQISGGHDVIVTWLEFKIDSVDYKLRTFYQFQPTTKADIAAGIAEAIHMSIGAAASRVRPEE